MSVAQIEPTELRRRLNAGEKIEMIDVREDEEVATGMIPGAKHIPLGQIPARLDEIDKSGEVIFICRSGRRSEHACEYLQQLGFDDVVNLTGGMIEWYNTEEE
ncbi:rhodanese-like domain-containing protein [Paenibacillus sediminis]|uniref:Rhodanese-related sulfurtransferase n=1 Tax=Paenibacillus sediminis TaxID=664909 RepID=A0ABS4GZ44_9BACL|nr:rhodanese-like domain-containing protein [Paenibacillus sediminis]MBP1935529.1 rhodanese-related sulfurtransferase [Paenibacillus sediminis]